MLGATCPKLNMTPLGLLIFMRTTFPVIMGLTVPVIVTKSPKPYVSWSCFTFKSTNILSTTETITVLDIISQDSFLYQPTQSHY